MTVGDCVAMLSTNNDYELNYIGIILEIEKILGMNAVTVLWSDGQIFSCSATVLRKLWPCCVNKGKH